MGDLVTVSAIINAPSSQLWGLVSDITTMGRWSPETTSCRWLGGSTAPVVGARFSGRNEFKGRRWQTVCTVTASEPGKVFAFTVKGLDVIPVAEWAYSFESLSENRCRVTESFADRRSWPLKTLGNWTLGIADRDVHNRAGMVATLAALKTATEAHT